jgi:hypothetical protein
MEKAIINQQTAIQLLKANKSLAHHTVRFDQTPVEALDVILLGKNGISVPKELIYYDDDAIDFSDDPDLTDEDLQTGNIKWLVNAKLSLDDEVKDWIKKEQINLNTLLSNLLTHFYKDVKSLPKV